MAKKPSKAAQEAEAARLRRNAALRQYGSEADFTAKWETPIQLGCGGLVLLVAGYIVYNVLIAPEPRTKEDRMEEIERKYGIDDHGAPHRRQ